jgi:DNA-binding IclR family transcriptional regulator
VGKVLASYLPEAEVEHQVQQKGLVRYNENTICSLKRLKEELALSRRRGWAIDDEEEEIGVRCIGAPIFGWDGEVIAAVSVVGKVNSRLMDDAACLAGMVKETAEEVSSAVKSHTETLRRKPCSDAVAASSCSGD